MRVRRPEGNQVRWAIAGGVALCWVVLAVFTGSAVEATILIFAIAGLGAVGFAGLRAMGVSRARQDEEHRWQDSADAYREPEYAAVGAKQWGYGQEHYEQGQYGQEQYGREHWDDRPADFEPAPVTWHERDSGMTVADGMATIKESALAPVPVLRLITGSSITQTLMSGARAGRGNVELPLPDVPTVSREHAKFTFSDGRWWVANLGINGITLNGEPLAGEQPLCDGDSIRWGTRPDSLLSRVELS